MDKKKAGFLLSYRLEGWRKSPESKTIQSLEKVFQEKSFAIALLILMITPALPVPTGGVTHVFEIIAILLAAEMVAGRRTIWLPRRFKNVKLEFLNGKAMTWLIPKIRWIEKYTRKRLVGVLQNNWFLKFLGLEIIIFCLAAFVAPPFSALDTLPAMGVVLVSLAIIFDDFIIFLAGNAAGFAGIALILLLGGALLQAFKNIF